jgi:pyruvate kinase
MVDNLRRAQRELGRSCKILTDLAGPKLRTGAIQSSGHILKIKPARDLRGRVTAPAQVWLAPAEISQDGPCGAGATLLAPRELLEKSLPGDALRFRDARDRKRKLRIVSCDGESRLAEISRTAYIEDGLEFTLYRHGEQLGSARFSHLPEVMAPLHLFVGDRLLLTRGDEPGQAAVCDYNGQIVKPAQIPCTLKEAFDAVKPGASVWLDDGKIGGTALDNNGETITVRITHANLKGGRLGAEKGINFPDTDLNVPALTAKDLEDLKFVVKYADMIGLSFVRAPEDVFLLQEHLAKLGAKRIGVILKIETRKAFEDLPQLLLASLCAPPVGVMVARGDLGVEVGFERLAEVQEEILWLCEASHAPVIWATQVLEEMATRGAPSRAEVSDAVMSGRAECVMLNKGPYIVDTVRFLNGILERMDAHQSKRRAMMRRLSISELR